MTSRRLVMASTVLALGSAPAKAQESRSSREAIDADAEQQSLRPAAASA
jgi:hypothetical protein